MAIEFRCSGCDKLLRTPEDKAGKSANCPECGHRVTVPAVAPPPEVAFSPADSNASGPGEDDFDSSSDFDQNVDGGDDGYDPNWDLTRERQSTPDGDQTCPMCGTVSGPESSRCRACGEDLSISNLNARPGRQSIDIGEAMRDGMEWLKPDLSIMIAATLIFGMLFWFIYMVAYFSSLILAGLVAAMVQGGGGGRPADETLFGMIVFLGGGSLMTILLGPPYTFLTLGFTRLTFNVLRGNTADLTDLFRGVQGFLPAIIINLFYGVLVLVTSGPAMALFMFGALAEDEVAGSGVGLILLSGTIFLIGSLLQLAFCVYLWPYYWVLVDRNTGVGETIGLSLAITRKSRLTVLGLMLIYGFIWTIAYTMCSLPLLFAYPYLVMMMGAAYIQVRNNSGTIDASTDPV
ncbi:hypothetical protein [Stratiformator vulcanicus]|uniref:Double zinc ribbon n=1 Tax=Stratiformator vulcanicus TaxID=2527980 RepID=A0A517R4T1_9PLAN|nr:hypothetical protein [Stratiformator vulcanicus]QDT38887.1 hypothetical protein Pan189_32860 [Stratiformator vulcanicus]